jgi:hypothetical protein
VDFVLTERYVLTLTDQERFETFTKELSHLSVRYGITIQSIGGVIIWDEGELSEVEYSNDSTSGDLISNVYVNAVFKCKHCNNTSTAKKWDEQTKRECGEIDKGIEEGYNNMNFYYICPVCGKKNYKNDLKKIRYLC